MKKKDVVDLIRYYVDANDTGFKNLAYDIAIEFTQNGDKQLGSYILSLLSSKSACFVPQSSGFASDWLKRIEPSSDSLLLPSEIMNDMNGIINAVNYKAGVGKFLFSGPPGTGKTEAAKHLARILNRQIYSVNFEMIIDSKLGQTAKNIAQVFDELNRQSFPESLIVLFDEIDSLAMDRMNSQDLREMGRATSTLMKGLDELNHDIVLIATTNMEDYFDRALLRRFDKVVDFSRYSNKDLQEVAVSLLSRELNRFHISFKNQRLCKHIFSAAKKLPYPGEMKNIIRTSIAFSDPAVPDAYIRILFSELISEDSLSRNKLQSMGFSLREMEVLLGISRSTLSRKMNEEDNDE